jgi:hypothetical protein
MSASWDDLTPMQIAARNHNELQISHRFQKGVSGNPLGRPKTKINAIEILDEFLMEPSEGNERARVVVALEKFADKIEDLDPEFFKLWIARSMPVINKLQAEVLHAEVRVAPELPDTAEVRSAVADALDADYEVIDGGSE